MFGSGLSAFTPLEKGAPFIDRGDLVRVAHLRELADVAYRRFLALLGHLRCLLDFLGRHREPPSIQLRLSEEMDLGIEVLHKTIG